MELVPGSMKVKTGVAAARGPMPAQSGVRSLADRDPAGWVRDRRDVEASVPAVTKPNLRYQRR